MNELYLLHFIDPKTLGHYRLSGHAGHYIGYCARGVPSRMAYHRRGAGSRLLKAVVDAGADFVVALIVPGDRTTERDLKQRVRNAYRLCPVCHDDARVYRFDGAPFVRFRPHRRLTGERRMMANLRTGGRP